MRRTIGTAVSPLIKALLLGAILQLVPASFAGGTTQAAATPSIDAMLRQLGNDDPVMRDHATQELMGLSIDDLPALRQCLQNGIALRPGETQVIHEIVTHVYLAGNPTESAVARGFMGIEMHKDDLIHSEGDTNPDLPAGVIVDNRLPGFSAYRMLRNGDLILSISCPDLPEDPNRAPTDDPHEHRVRSSMEIISLVRTLSAGHTVMVQLLRSGQRMRVPITLGPRPIALPETPGPAYQQYWQQRLDKAAEYWTANFGWLGDHSVS